MHKTSWRINMIGTAKAALLTAAVLLLAATFFHTSVGAGASATSQGVALIQIGCGEDNNGNISGPFTSYLYGGYNACSNGTGTAPTPLPSGMLYNMRVLVYGYTSDSAADFKVSLFTSAHRKPVMVCGVGIPVVNTCNDLTDTVAVNAGDTVWATVSVPDSNSQLVSVALTVEESVTQ